MDFKIELIKEKECEEVAKLIADTAKESFKCFYPKKVIERIIKSLDKDGVKKRASWTHFYVAKDENKIVGCGAIGPYWGSEVESSLFTIFVHPDYQKHGLGRKIIETLENDEYFLRANRIEIPASISAIPFYLKCGYKHKNDEVIFEDDNIKLEKFNNKTTEKEL